MPGLANVPGKKKPIDRLANVQERRQPTNNSELLADLRKAREISEIKRKEKESSIRERDPAREKKKKERDKKRKEKDERGNVCRRIERRAWNRDNRNGNTPNDIEVEGDPGNVRRRSECWAWNRDVRYPNALRKGNSAGGSTFPRMQQQQSSLTNVEDGMNVSAE